VSIWRSLTSPRSWIAVSSHSSCYGALLRRRVIGWLRATGPRTGSCVWSERPARRWSEWLARHAISFELTEGSHRSPLRYALQVRPLDTDPQWWRVKRRDSRSLIVVFSRTSRGNPSACGRRIARVFRILFGILLAGFYFCWDCFGLGTVQITEALEVLLYMVVGAVVLLLAWCAGCMYIWRRFTAPFSIGRRYPAVSAPAEGAPVPIQFPPLHGLWRPQQSRSPF